MTYPLDRSILVLHWRYANVITDVRLHKENLMQCVPSLLDSPLGIAVAIIGAVLFLWARLVRTFASTIEELARPRNKQALRAIASFIKEQVRKAATPPSVPRDLSVSAKVAHWVTAAVYCLFVAWFSIYGACVLALGFLLLQQSAKALTLVVLSLLLFACAKYYHKLARHLHSALRN